MKKHILLFLSLLLGASTGFAATYSVDTSESDITWTGTKITGRHHGHVSLKSGAMEFDGNVLTGGNAVIDMPTLKVEDIEDPVSNQKLENHLKSSDFFDVAAHETAEIRITEAALLEGGIYDITADVTIKGKTEPVQFQATVQQEEDKAYAEATITLDRAKFDVRYGSGTFFEDLGDKLIHDEFTLDVVITAQKQ